MNDIQQLWENNIRKKFDAFQDLLEGLDYNLFQTPYKPNPDLLIININRNPESYNDASTFDSPTNIYTQGKKGGEKEPVNEMICNLFGYERNEKLWNVLENAVGMNFMYFNESALRKTADTYLQQDIRAACLQYTRLMIDEYICPKNILAIGNDAFTTIKNNVREDTVRWGLAYILKSFRNQTPVYYLHDPSKRLYLLKKESNIKEHNSLLEFVFCS